MDCLSYEDLALAFADPEERSGALEHLRGGCAPCLQRWQLLLAMEAAHAAGPFPEVPPQLSRWAREVPARAAEASGLEAAAKDGGAVAGTVTGAVTGAIGDALREWADHVGQLVYDSLRPALRSAPAGALRGGPAAGRYLLFRAGPYEFDLSVVEPDSLVGQLVSSDATAPSLTDAVCVLEGGTGIRQTALEEHGDFCFDGVEPGRYTLAVEGEGVRVVLEEIDLADPDSPRIEA